MKKVVDALLRDYVGRLPDDHLKFLDSRLGQRLGGDLGEAVFLLSQSHEMDNWLSTARGAVEFYDMVDAVSLSVERECRRRYRDDR
jgi:hypothetical protein